jgi:hypothetical protein
MTNALVHIRRFRVHVEFAEVSIKLTESRDSHPKHLLYLRNRNCRRGLCYDRLQIMVVDPAFSVPREVYSSK